jgi:glycosyltransferase involved in cell wall biosynthesis
MKIVFFAHPSFLGSQSMSRFASMLSKGMEQHGHRVEIWSPKAKFFKIPAPMFIRKWLGYIDQYIVFGFEVKKRLKGCSEDTLFVFTDQALGPWIPWINNRPHVIHCHDFLAQRSAKGEIEENPTSWTGRQYQTYIRNGYQKGKNFISVSEKTREDLHRFLLDPPAISEVVYNSLNQTFVPLDQKEARVLLGNKIGLDLNEGYILHIGGNQWYKNRIGVIEIYNEFRLINDITLPLLLIGKQPSASLLEVYERSAFKDDIHFLCDIEDKMLSIAYSGATVFIFPSLAEGFGWPIAEAMACGCPVITTNEAPMTEVAGKAGLFINIKPNDNIKSWAKKSAQVVNDIVKISIADRKEIVKAGLLNSERFNAKKIIDNVEQVYLKIIG